MPGSTTPDQTNPANPSSTKPDQANPGANPSAAAPATATPDQTNPNANPNGQATTNPSDNSANSNKKMPATGSPLPLMAALGLGLMGLGYGLRRRAFNS